mmetsp:Transcript_6747/g.9932  ORF Transcript_6747/g.9932 Transcript_6747/m.9932 type:complete len:171 (+) Transcript_6747:143-655(+)|eukprot:CAMPEP_0197738790 /NCGR_PEP_ID=MMETSP1435-20131217/16535_1 /TAXON_ID=426625 /ORGANISM="Chaetoceros brevis, Strain CCMP164" /LENGTH=170 /DNA_ID=CAMNT_0043327837 /DNA_START=85 /DNA_END=597 /DNA_ORIENTATION=+
MVKHGRAKKRRAGRTGRTKLKNGNYRIFRPATIKDPVIKAMWDQRRSPAANMETLGLRLSTGKDVLASSSKQSGECKAIELYDIPASDIIPKKTLNQRMLPVSIEDQQYIAKLFKKHGNNYAKMARDIKLNEMQHTGAKLRKIGARFLLLSQKDIRVEIPENIKDLMSEL